jgi:uncharacterized membrane protein YkvA (DUF1232 family)
MPVALLPIDFLPWGLLLATLGLYLAGIVALIIAGRRSAARAVAGFVPDCAVMLKRLLTSQRMSAWERVLVIALVAYLASPIDVVPDFVPVAGQLDDAVLVAAVLALLLRRHGEDAIRAAWPGPEGSLKVILRAAGAPQAPKEGRATL